MERYERLTYKKIDLDKLSEKAKSKISDTYLEYVKMNNALWELENKIENGTLIELPCKVGDKVYHLSDKKISEETVKQIKYILNNGEIDLLNSYIMTDDIYSKDYNFYRLSKLGKSVFLTKAEAEAKLKNLGELK